MVWTVRLEQDEHGNVIVPLPDDLLQQLGWTEGDDIEIVVVPETKAIILRRQL